MVKTSDLLNNGISVLNHGTSGPVFLWPFYPHRGNELEHMEEVVEAELADCDFSIVAFEVADWNRDLSPWKAAGLADGEVFAGGGRATLDWIEKSMIPWIWESYPEWKKLKREIYLMGYSLAGLFAMWSMYESDCFDGAVCCSSSFWMEGWKEYAENHSVKRDGSIYLSLGGKEEKSKHPLMATVGDRTREMEKLLKADPKVRRCRLEMNSGGHFADSARRMIKGIRFIC